MSHRIEPRPLAVVGDLTQHLLRDRAHRGYFLDLLFGDPGVVNNGLHDQAVRVADQDVSCLAVSLHRHPGTIFHTHFHYPVDDRDALARNIHVFRSEFPYDLIRYHLAFSDGFRVDLFEILKCEPRIIGLAVGHLDHRCQEKSLVSGEAGVIKFGPFEKFGRRLFSLCAKFVGDLLCAAFLLKKLLFCFGRATRGHGGPVKAIAIKIPPQAPDDTTFVD